MTEKFDLKFCKLTFLWVYNQVINKITKFEMALKLS